MRRLVISCLAIIFLSVFAAPVFAAPDQQPMPAWLVEAEAKPVVDVELDAVQGEFEFVTLAVIMCKAAAILTLAEIAYFHYKLITGKSLNSQERMFMEEVTGLKIPQFPSKNQELRWIQGK